MKSPFDQNPEQEAEQQYERNLARNYPADERAGIRASDQRASYQAATLKLNAEKEAQNIRDNSIRLGIAQAVEARAIKADALAIKSSTAELAVKEWEAKRNEMALDQVPLMVAEIEKRRGPKGYLSTADETAVRLSLPYAAFSKNATINKIWEDEGSLRRSLMATEAANLEIRTKEDRAKAAAAAERARLEGMAKDLPISQVVSDGVTYKKPELPKPMDTGTRTVTQSPGGLETVSERRPITPDTAPAAPASLRPIFKDSKGKRAYKNPDGTFELIP